MLGLADWWRQQLLLAATRGCRLSCGVGSTKELILLGHVTKLCDEPFDRKARGKQDTS
jgi:hypothetical protein